MAIIPRHLHLLAMESQRRIFKGKCLTLGQQAVFATLDGVKSIYRSHAASLFPEPKDTKTKIPSWQGTRNANKTNAQTVLKLLGADEVLAADVSNYENADLVFDLNEPVDQALHGQFDLVFDVGTLEHVYDVPTALSNIVRLLKVGGSAIIISPVSNAIDHGFYSFSPTLFYDFFALNGFEDFRCYLLEASSSNTLKPGRVYRYDGLGGEQPLRSKRIVEVFFAATKVKESTTIQKPVQSVYAKWKNWPSASPAAGAELKVRAETPAERLRRVTLFYLEKGRARLKSILRHKRLQMIGDNLTYIGHF